MSQTPSTTLQHLSFGERPQYGTPYPEGIATGHIDVTGDATGGTITASFLTLPRFLYRLELIQATKAETGATDVSFTTHHQMLTDATGFGAGAFTLNWHTVQGTVNGFAVFLPRPDSMSMIRRVPQGSIGQSDGEFICVFTSNENTNTIVWDFDVIYSYWPSTALQLPGFLSSFYEAPAIAGLLP